MHGHAVEMSREGAPIMVIQRQLGHADLGATSVYLHGIDDTEVIDTVHERRPPMIPAGRLATPDVDRAPAVGSPPRHATERQPGGTRKQQGPARSDRDETARHGTHALDAIRAGADRRARGWADASGVVPQLLGSRLPRLIGDCRTTVRSEERAAADQSDERSL
jgi:hypothetical protein